LLQYYCQEQKNMVYAK